VSAITDQLDPFTSPTIDDVIYAGVIATVAFAGIEAAANLAPDIETVAVDLRKLVVVAAALVPVIYFGVSVIALMAVPVQPTPDGPQTALGGAFIEDPVLGVVQSFQPGWVSDLMQVAVVAIVPVALIWAANTAMLGLSRHVYVLATNRQIPSWLGKLGPRRQTPYIAIWAAAVICAGLVVPGDIEFLAGVYAFGATLAIAIAHISIVRLRMTQPDKPRPFRIPLNVSFRGHSLPVPALAGAVLMSLAWVSVIGLHGGARYVGGAWMIFGLVAYVIYRLVVEDTTLTKRVQVPASALTKKVRVIEYGEILVPVFGTQLDDDILSTAGRLADAALDPDEEPPKIEVIYVVEVPLKLPLDARPPSDKMEVANRALERAQEVGSEYETVEVGTSVVRARSVGAGIVLAARERNAELIVMGGEPPTEVRGGALLGGVGGARPDEIGPVTEYVLAKAPCRVLLTAPASDRLATKHTPAPKSGAQVAG